MYSLCLDQKSRSGHQLQVWFLVTNCVWSLMSVHRSLFIVFWFSSRLTMANNPGNTSGKWKYLRDNRFCHCRFCCFVVIRLNIILETCATFTEHLTYWHFLVAIWLSKYCSGFRVVYSYLTLYIIYLYLRFKFKFRLKFHKQANNLNEFFFFLFDLIRLIHFQF